MGPRDRSVLPAVCAAVDATWAPTLAVGRRMRQIRPGRHPEPPRLRGLSRTQIDAKHRENACCPFPLLKTENRPGRCPTFNSRPSSRQGQIRLDRMTCTPSLLILRIAQSRPSAFQSTAHTGNQPNGDQPQRARSTPRQERTPTQPRRHGPTSVRACRPRTIRRTS